MKEPRCALFRIPSFGRFSYKLVYVSYTPLPAEATVRIPDHPTLIRRMLEARLKKLAGRTPVLAASFCVLRVRCGRPSCRCARSDHRHTVQRLTYQDQGTTRTVHVPKDLVQEVRVWIAEHHRLKTLLKEIHALSMALVRTHVRHRRRRAGRP